MRHVSRVRRAGHHAAAGDRVSVHGGHEGFGKCEERFERLADGRQEGAHVRRAAVNDAQEVDPGRKDRPGACQDEGGNRRCPAALVQLLRQGVAEFQIKRAGFAVRHSQDRDLAALFETCHVTARS